MLSEQGTALTLGHAAPHPELHPIVEGIGATFELHGAVPTDCRGLTLSRSANEQVVGVSSPASCL